MRPAFSYLAALSAVLALAGTASAQEAPLAPAGRAPGEEVMQPTKHGLRLNPGMARGMATAWLMNDGMWQDLELSPQQERQLANAFSRRMMDLGHRDGQAAQPAIECFLESMMATNGNLKKLGAERSREFGQKLLPLARTFREFIAGMEEDAGPLLNDEQKKLLREQVEWQQKKLNNFEKRLNTWAEGNYQEGDNPFDELEDQESQPANRRLKPEVRRARRTAEWDIRRLGDWDWGRFLAGVAMMFQFDAAQRARGEALLADYRKKADAIMTPQWRKRMLQNRMQFNAANSLGDTPVAPWVYGLDKEFKSAARPLQELGDAFRRDVLALITPDQRATAMQQVRQTAEKHGLAITDTDAALLLGLVQQPATLPAAGG